MRPEFRARWRDYLDDYWPSWGRRFRLAGLVALSAVTAVVVVYALQTPDPPPGSFASDGGVSVVDPPHTGLPTTPLAAVEREITAAVSARTWPELQPELGQLAKSGAPEAKACDSVDVANRAGCSFGSSASDKVVVVLGDRAGVDWLPGIRSALEPKGWRIQGLTYSRCPAPVIWVTATKASAGHDGDALTRRCSAHQLWALKRVAKVKPDLVVFASAQDNLDRLGSGARGKDAEAAWQSAVTDTVNGLHKAVSKVVVLAPPPDAKDVSSCDSSRTPADCVSDIGATWLSMSRADRASARETRASYVDTSSWFCDSHGGCPPFVGSTVVRTDGMHLTAAYSKKLAPLLADALLAAPKH